MNNTKWKIYLIITVLLLFTPIPASSFADENDDIDGDTGRPVLHSAYPLSTDTSKWFDEKALKHTLSDGLTKDIYFVKAVFKDIEDNLKFSGLDNLKNCIIRPINGSGNLLDMDFINKILDMEDSLRDETINKYIFVRNTDEVTLYLPMKELRAQTTYEVTLASQLVSYDNIEDQLGNEIITWTFTTTTTPFVDKISTGSIPENYDASIPLIIYGDFFYGDTISVYFNDIKASLGKKTMETLEVYLPSGSHRLKAGIYDILVQNDANHQRTIHGSLGVVKAGEALLGDGYIVKKTISKGEIRSDVKLSQDTLLLSSRYNNDAYLRIDLDEWMGEDVLVREIRFDGDSRYKIGMMETKSKWADITLYELALAHGSPNGEINLRLGRSEPEVMKSLRTRLRNQVVRSEFIQVTGENLRFKNIFLSIPIQKGVSKNLKVYRYDEETRSFYEEPATINLVDQRAELFTSNKGIFVIIEK